ncbi:helix-turn-helix domain-containing protein [Nocardiopsis exhalans]|uniref:Helix-turn-helix domain-containing protein n=1 Tax=Nocardiopsis exhalans TaxID=163604 RepID=A0ABY5D1K0_9ACTN|nr:helix-turn-helix transcriptional regulator [Nocardiopsis exhalans]USY17850.1 helix-turn-helix domain-containing protein [Nocardiopsis exhalans]
MGKHIPTVRTRRLTGELRRHREKAGLTWEEVYEPMGWSESKMYRIENDKSRVIPRDVKRLLNLYGVTGEEFDALMELAKKATEKGWWHEYGQDLPSWFSFYIGLEDAASGIREYQMSLVPGLLQTEAYMRAILSTAPLTDSDDGIERKVEVRLARQARVTADDAPLGLWMILDEAVIRRQVGGPDIMREQIQHLINLAGRRNVTLQILPFRAGEHASMLGAFTLLEFPGADDPDVAYQESQTGSLYVEKPDQVGRYSLMFDHLREKALSGAESLTLLKQAGKDLK